jgi:hypothetical protein
MEKLLAGCQEVHLGSKEKEDEQDNYFLEIVNQIHKRYYILC